MVVDFVGSGFVVALVAATPDFEPQGPTAWLGAAVLETGGEALIATACKSAQIAEKVELQLDDAPMQRTEQAQEVPVTQHEDSLLGQFCFD